MSYMMENVSISYYFTTHIKIKESSFISTVLHEKA